MRGAALCSRGGVGGQVWLFHSNYMNTEIKKRRGGGGKPFSRSAVSVIQCFVPIIKLYVLRFNNALEP